MAFFMVSQFLMPYTLIILLSVGTLGSDWFRKRIVSILAAPLTVQTAQPVQLQVISGKSCRKSGKLSATHHHRCPTQPTSPEHLPAKRRARQPVRHLGIHWGVDVLSIMLEPALPGVLFSPACRGVAQPGSALAWGARGREFESRRPDQLNNRPVPVFLILRLIN